MGWFYENVNQFTLEAGVVGDAVKELKFKGQIKNFFLKALNMIHQAKILVDHERIRMEMEKRKNG